VDNYLRPLSSIKASAVRTVGATSSAPARSTRLDGTWRKSQCSLILGPVLPVDRLARLVFLAAFALTVFFAAFFAAFLFIAMQHPRDT